MREIKLTQEQVAFVDDEDFEELNRFNWYAQQNGKTYYAMRRLRQDESSEKEIKMQYQIMGKAPEGLELDHRDGNGLNDQRSNLRFVTHRKNMQNIQNMDKSSQYPGVSWNVNEKKWRAYIKVKNVQIHLGYFFDEEKAYDAYCEAYDRIESLVVSKKEKEKIQNILKQLKELAED